MPPGVTRTDFYRCALLLIEPYLLAYVHGLMLELTVISGGQTGVDRAALDAALDLGIPVSGWCPAGRWAEDGPISDEYPLLETPDSDPLQRTEYNVEESDGVLIFYSPNSSPGTEATIDAAEELGRPLFVVRLGVGKKLYKAVEWMEFHGIQCLNVAGPRASEYPDVYEEAYFVIRGILDSLLRVRLHR